MSTLVGFEIGFWDYVTFAALALVILSAFIFVMWVAGLPGRIAIARKHPEAEAVKIMGFAGFLAVVPWIQAFIWAFKPTDVVDVRSFPPEEAARIDEEISRLSGTTDSPKTPDPAPAPGEPPAGPRRDDSE